MALKNGIKTSLSIVFLAVVLMSVTANAGEITYDGFVSWNKDTDPGTFDASESDKLVVVVSGEHNFPANYTGNVTGITYNGTTLIKAVEESPADPATGGHGQTTADIWYLDNPGSYAGDGTIDVSFNGNNWVVTAIALSGTAEGVGATAHVSGAASLDLTTTVADSIVIASLGMGGSGNTTDINVSPNTPLTKIDALKIGSNWAGHVVGYSFISLPELQTFSFDTTKTDVVTVAAEFEPFIPDPNLPSVEIGDSWITWSGREVTMAPVVVNKDTRQPQRELSYSWIADPADGVVFSPDANVAAPNVTVTKSENTGDATVVTLTLAVTLEGLGSTSDDLRLYVFDDSCHAGLGCGSVVVGAGDLNVNCFTDLEDFAILAESWLVDYDVAELAMVADTWLEGDVLPSPVTAPAIVPDVTGESKSAAESILTDAGFTTSLIYEYDENVPLNYVIAQSPAADSEVPNGINVTLIISKGDPPASEITVAEVYLAQTHVQKPDDALFKLVGNRDTLLKVQVIAPEGTAVPQVTAVLSVDDETTTLTLDDPLALQDTFENKIGKVQHKYDDSFTTLIPAQWIRPGLSITVTAGNSNVSHDIKVGAPSVVKMKMFDVHYFGLGTNDYPAGTLEELEAKWPVSDLSVERIRNINFHELVVPARAGVPYVRISSKQDYKDQTGLNFDGEQAAALQWVEALSASGGNFDVAMQYINIIGVSAGGQAGGFDGVGGISVGIFNHELGHALSLPHWGDNGSYPYKGPMYGIEPQPGVYMGTHVGPAWAFDLPSLTFIPPTVQENSVGGEVGYYKKTPMQGGGAGDQEVGFLMRHFSDFGVNKMQNYIEGKVAVLREGEYYKWNQSAGDYTTHIASNGVRYPIEEDVQVISVMAATTVADPNVNMVYPPIGPYEGNLIRTFDPNIPADRTEAAAVFAPSGGCDFSLRVVQGGQTKTYMLQASATEGSPLSNGTLKTKAINLRASDGEVTQVELLLTPDAEINGLPSNPEVLYTWTE